MSHANQKFFDYCCRIIDGFVLMPALLHWPWITGQLYGWFGEERIAQEMVLGIGGVKALRALGIEPEVYHFNEGHALFAGFELIREKMSGGDSYEEAKKKSREEIVFTTHTPVIQGNEEHDIDQQLDNRHAFAIQFAAPAKMILRLVP